MLTAKDLNAKVDEYAQQILIPQGFKKSGVHYYKSNPPHYYALIKGTFKGLFTDYYLVYHHEAGGKNYETIVKKPQSLMRLYPVSVQLRELPIIYSVANKPVDSPYTFFSLARSYEVDKNCKESEAAWLDGFAYRKLRDEKLQTDADYLNTYVEDLFKIIEQYGIRFFDECNLDVCYHSMYDAIENKKNDTYLPFYLEYKNDFDAYCTLKGIDIPPPQGFGKVKNVFQKFTSFFSKK